MIAGIMIGLLILMSGMMDPVTTCHAEIDMPEITIHTSGNGIRELIFDSSEVYAITNGGLVIWDFYTAEYTKLTTQDGLSDNWLICGVMDNENRLWMGSMMGGLNIWNGSDIEIYAHNDQLPFSEITVLDIDSQNRIWAGFGGPFGTGLGIMENDEWSFLKKTDGLLHNYINAIETRGIDGWTGSRGGLNYIQDMAVIRSYTSEDGLPSDKIQCLSAGDANTLWVGTDTGLAFFDGTDFTTYGVEDGLPSADIRSLHYTDFTAELWIGTADGLALRKNEEITVLNPPESLKSGTFTALASRNNVVLAGTHTSGFAGHQYDEFVKVYLTDDWLPDNDVRAVTFDGNRMWFATFNHGVGYIEGDTIQTFLLEANDRVLELRFLTRDHLGRIYTGDLYQGVFIYDGETWNRLTHDDGLPVDGVMNVFIDDDNSAWFASWGGGVAHLKDERWTYIDADDGLPCPHVYCVDKDRNGDYWFCHDQGVTRYDGENLESWFEEDGLIFHRVYASTVDDNNVKWFGACKGLSRFENGQFTNYMTDDGLTHYRVRHFLFDAQNVLWMATGGGICALDHGEFASLTPEQGVAGYETFWCCHGPGGSLWFSSEGGITELNPRYDTGVTGARFVMPTDRLEPGDFLDCTVRVCNAGPTALEGYPLFVILEVAGEYFFGPDFTSELDHYLDIYPVFEPGITEVTVIPPMHWPPGVDSGSLSSAVFYAGLATPDLTAVYGEIDSAELRWE